MAPHPVRDVLGQSRIRALRGTPGAGTVTATSSGLGANSSLQFECSRVRAPPACSSTPAPALMSDSWFRRWFGLGFIELTRMRNPWWI